MKQASLGKTQACLLVKCFARPFFRHKNKSHEVNVTQLLPYRHSWPGPGILWLWLALVITGIVQFMKIRSLVLARDDVSQALCSFRVRTSC